MEKRENFSVSMPASITLFSNGDVPTEIKEALIKFCPQCFIQLIFKLSYGGISSMNCIR